MLDQLFDLYNIISRSSDLNAIENLYYMIGRTLQE